MAVTVYQYPRCSTCKKALAWLDEHGIDYRKIDVVENPPSSSRLHDLWMRSGLPIRKLFNTAGQSYRQGGYRDKLPDMTDAEAIEHLSADGKLVKRPIVDAGEAVLVGFRADEYERRLKP